MLKNLTLYKIDGGWTLTAGALEDILRQHELIAPSKLSSSSRGWVPVGPSGEYVFATEKQLLFCAGIETKVVPPSTLRRETEAKCKEIEARQGFKVGKKQKREAKDQVLLDLLSKAMTTLSETRVWVDAMNGYLAIDTPSLKKADDITSMLRDHLGGSLPVVIPESELSPATAMQRWLTSGKASNGISVGASAELVSSDGSKAKVKFANHEMVGCEQVTTHLETGKTVSSMQLDWNEYATFTLTDKLQVKGIKYTAPDSETDDQAGKGEKDAQVQFEADFRIATYTLQGIVNGLSSALGFKE